MAQVRGFFLAFIWEKPMNKTRIWPPYGYTESYTEMCSAQCAHATLLANVGKAGTCWPDG